LVPGNDEWKEFIARPALKVILRFLAGLATDHEPTQVSKKKKKKKKKMLILKK
jgi:hypothetical protein